MRGLSNPRRLAAAIAGMGALAAAGAGWALAAGGSSGVIDACANKGDGALRVAASCTKSERSLTWNVQSSSRPAFGFVSTGDDPPALKSSSVVLATKTVHLPAAGPLWLSAHFEPSITCSGGCTVTYGIYVDGKPIHGGRRQYTAPGIYGTNETWGISAPLTEGTHKITLEYTPVGASVTELVTTELGGILLG